MRRMFVLMLVILLAISLVVSQAVAFEVIEPKYSSSGVNTTVANEREWVITGINGRASDGSIQIAVNGYYVRGDVKPFIDEAYRTQAPFRMISEALGCVVEWNEETQTVTATKPGYTIVMNIGNSNYRVNGVSKMMDTAPQLRDSRTFIPVRAFAEALDCEVYWSEQALLVMIEKQL